MTRHCKALLNQRFYIYYFFIALTRDVLEGSYLLLHAQCRAHSDDNNNDNSHEHMLHITFIYPCNNPKRQVVSFFLFAHEETEAGCLSCVVSRSGDGFESKLLCCRSLDFAVLVRRIGYGAGEMAQWLEVLVVMDGSLSQIPETHVVEEEN